MSNFLQANPRVLVLIIGLISVAGCVAFVTLPRMEDPQMVPRVAKVVTLFPGANAERVEALVTDKLERAIREVEEVKEISSTSSSNVSFIAVELHDRVDAAGTENAWAIIRDKIEQTESELPVGAYSPEFSKYEITASAVILALKWELDTDPNYAILKRLTKQLRDEVDAIPGTEKTELFGDPEEEILVTLDRDAMTSLGLNPQNIAATIAASDSKVSAGQLRSGTDNIQLEVVGELDSLARVGKIPVQVATVNNFVDLGDVAKIEKTIQQPLETKVLLKDQPAVALGAQVESMTRIDVWSKRLERTLDAFAADLPAGISIVRIFEQSPYVSSRMTSLFRNLIYGAAAIFFVILFMMGWRAAWIVGMALPLVSLAVLASMKWLEIPIHQMSITGLIIALGLMIDNAIVVVDEITQRVAAGKSKRDAVQETVSYLFIPLAGSTVTTALSFSPIILMQGMAGEFVGAIAIVAVVAVVSSFLLAMTVIASLAGLGLSNQNSGSGWLSTGFTSPTLSAIFGRFLDTMLRYPIVGVVVGILLPVLGLLSAPTLREQFFPPSERNQFRIELELPATASIHSTEDYAKMIGDELLGDPRIEDVTWFLGGSPLMFYYNVIPFRENVPQYGQAIIDCEKGVDMIPFMREVQNRLAPQFPQAAVVVRQLEQGPAFDAPIEIRISGAEPQRLRELGNEVRLLLTHIDDIVYSKASFSESLPKVAFVVDEQQARLVGLDHTAVARELSMSLDGITGGSMMEDSEELPVRVRVSGHQRKDIDSVASFDIVPQPLGIGGSGDHDHNYRGVPLSAISKLSLESETVRIFHRDGVRMNEVQAYLKAGVLPATVLREFRRALDASAITLPRGYEITYGGAEAQRDDAVGSLLGNVFIVISLMITAMVISLGSFRLAVLLFSIAGLSIGLGLGSLWLCDMPWGFMSMVAMMGMIGVAVNDSIVVLAAIRELPTARRSDVAAVRDSVQKSARHILSTTLTTIFGFLPLFLFGGDFWRPVAVAISGGVGGATILALVSVPCAYRLLYPSRTPSSAEERLAESAAPFHAV